VAYEHSEGWGAASTKIVISGGFEHPACRRQRRREHGIACAYPWRVPDQHLAASELVPA
jgi:hypothetical protein